MTKTTGGRAGDVTASLHFNRHMGWTSEDLHAEVTLPPYVLTPPTHEGTMEPRELASPKSVLHEGLPRAVGFDPCHAATGTALLLTTVTSCTLWKGTTLLHV